MVEYLLLYTCDTVVSCGIGWAKDWFVGQSLLVGVGVFIESTFERIPQGRV